MISSDGWFDWAARDPGPQDKQYATTNAMAGLVAHSMEGSFAGARSRLFSDQRGADGRYDAYAAASWTASSLKDGRLVQHYPLTASVWASGAAYPNTHFVAIEHEGVAGQPLTEPQVGTLARAIRELAAHAGWAPRRPATGHDVTATLYEHCECIRWGSGPTACPSDRIPWARVLGEEGANDEMWHRINGMAPWWKGRRLGPGPEGVIQLGSDFPALPASASAVDLEVFLAPESTGSFVLKDGTGTYAGQVNEHRLQQVVRVIPSNGQARFEVRGGAVQIELLGIVGYLS